MQEIYHIHRGGVMTPLSSTLVVGEPVYYRSYWIVEVPCTITGADGTTHSFTVYLDDCYLSDWSPGSPNVDATNAKRLAGEFVRKMWQDQDSSLIKGLCADSILYFPVNTSERRVLSFARNLPDCKLYPSTIFNGNWPKGLAVYATRN